MPALTHCQRGVLRRRLIAIDIHMSCLSRSIASMGRDIGQQYAYTLEQRRTNYAAAATVNEHLLTQSRKLDEQVLRMQNLTDRRRELIRAMGRGDEPATCGAPVKVRAQRGMAGTVANLAAFKALAP